MFQSTRQANRRDVIVFSMMVCAVMLCCLSRECRLICNVLWGIIVVVLVCTKGVSSSVVARENIKKHDNFSEFGRPRHILNHGFAAITVKYG